MGDVAILQQQLSGDPCWRCIKQHSGKHKTAVTLVAWVSRREVLRNVTHYVTEKKRSWLSVLWKCSSETGSFLRCAVKIATFSQRCLQPLQPVNVCPPQVTQIRTTTKLWKQLPCCCAQVSTSRMSTPLWSRHLGAIYCLVFTCYITFRWLSASLYF